MDRRGFLGSILAACAAPAIVRADSLMRIVPADALVLQGGDWIAKSDLMFAGAIREIWQYDFLWDRTITRFDLIGRNSFDRPIQLGVDIWTAHGARPADEERKLALKVLRRNAKDGGLKPVVGALQIPDGVRGRYL